MKTCGYGTGHAGGMDPGKTDVVLKGGVPKGWGPRILLWLLSCVLPENEKLSLPLIRVQSCDVPISLYVSCSRNSIMHLFIFISVFKIHGKSQ